LTLIEGTGKNKMIIPLLAVALVQLTPQQEADQKANENQLKQWVKIISLNSNSI
jgi:hypothetical protein